MSFNSLKSYINESMVSINGLYTSAIGMFAEDPNATFGGQIAALSAGIQTFAISLLSLFFLIGFLQKTLDFGWVKFENVFLFSAKVTMVHAVVNQTDDFMQLVFSSFNNLALTAIAGNAPGTGFLTPTGGGSDFSSMILGSNYAHLSTSTGIFANIERLGTMFSLLPTFLIMQLTMLVVMVLIIGRLFELAVMIIAAPIPLAGFASEATKDIAIGFLKNFIAVTLQTFILIVMFQVFGQIRTRLITLAGGGSIALLLTAFVLALGVIKSGSWAKKLCGAI